MPDFLKATVETLKIAILSGFFALILGILLASVYQLKTKPLNFLINLYTSIVRGTPLLVQLYFVYYGLSNIGIMVDSYTGAIAAFTFNTGAYMAEIFRGGLEGIDKGQFNAAYSLGMSWTACLRNIIFPQVLQRIISPLLTQLAYLIKDTSLAAVLVIRELTYTYRHLASNTYRSFEALVPPMIIYFGLYVIFRLASICFAAKKGGKA
ncbi:MAG: amino acid ABC transporter permease [Treponema sp.]|jgi:polar amino acid transport system permease protein|nr:amino acid ABC transporter permease [Treponema sp.]